MKLPLQVALVAATMLVGIQALLGAKAGEGTLELTIVDQQTRKPIPCRVHLLNSKGVPRKAPKTLFWQDHFACSGQVTLTLPRGNYTFVIERGPEYADATGYFTINDFADDRKTAELKRAVDMSAEGWWSGDLRVRRPARDLELLMNAEDLHVAVDVPQPAREPEAAQQLKPGLLRFANERYCWWLAGAERAHGRLAIELKHEHAESTNDASPSASDHAEPEHSRLDGPWYDVDDPSAPELPVWLALGKVDSFCLLGGEIVRPKREPGKKPSRKNANATHAAAELAQQVYFHLLDCGLRVPPSAASNSGAAANPIGYNRMYAWVDLAEFGPERWWRAVAMGRVTVTNGPLVRPQANGRLPGHEFRLLDGKLELDVAMNLTTRDPITYLELVKNGRTAASIRLSDWAKTGHFPPVRFDEPGWLLVRVVTDVPSTYRAAFSAPWYVDGSGVRRISRKSVQYFLDRLHALTKFSEPAQLSSTPAERQRAEMFWNELLKKANAD